MGINDGVLVYYPLAKVQLRGTDRLHCANEHEDIDCSREKAQRRSNQVEQHPEESCKSECWKDDPYGYRTWAEGYGSGQADN